MRTDLNNKGELAQLARALAWHARGHRFESGILHKPNPYAPGLFTLTTFYSAVAQFSKNQMQFILLLDFENFASEQ